MLTAQSSLNVPGNRTGEDTSLDHARIHMNIQQQIPDINVSSASHQTTPPSVSRKDPTEVAAKNNRILAKVCQDLNHFTTYGPAIDEFYHWCRDVRAYHPLNEQAILKCLEVIKKKAPNCGMWSALRVFGVAMSHKNRLSPQFEETVITWYEELKKNTPGYESPVNQMQPPPTGNHYDTRPSANNGIQNGDIRPHPNSPTVNLNTTQFNPFYNIPASNVALQCPTPPLTSAAAPIASSQSMQFPSTSSTYSNSTVAPVNTPNSALYTSQYQQALLQWQYMWLSQQQLQQQQQQRQRTNSQSPNVPVQSSSINSANYMQPIQGLAPALDLWMNAIDKSGQLMAPRNNTPILPSTSSRAQHTAKNSPVHSTQHTSSSVDCLSVGYLRPIGRALAPFKLQHNQPVANVKLNINADIYSKLWKRTVFKLPGANDADNQLPITFVLNCWKTHESDQKCEWPEKTELAVNGTSIQPIRKRKVQVPNKPNNVCMLIGKDRPLDLTPVLIQGTNVISIKQNICACAYVFDISIYFQESEDLIRSRVKSRKSDTSRGQRLVHKLIGLKEVKDENLATSSAATLPLTGNESGSTEVGDEIECMQTSIKVSLRCPISLLRIKEPVKGLKCLHVECFDLNSYLCVNRGLAKWKCPVCSKVSISSELVYDEYFMGLLGDMGEEVTHIEYTSDSRNWKAVGFEAADDDDDGSDGEGHSSSPVPKSEPVTAQAKRKSDVDLVNLVSDDEDETPDMGNVAKRSKCDAATQPSDMTMDQSIANANISPLSTANAGTIASGTPSIDSGKGKSNDEQNSISQTYTTPSVVTTSMPKYTSSSASLSTVPVAEPTIAGIAVPPVVTPTQLAPAKQADFVRPAGSSNIVPSSARVSINSTPHRQVRANPPCSLYVPKKLSKK